MSRKRGKRNKATRESDRVSLVRSGWANTQADSHTGRQTKHNKPHTNEPFHDVAAAEALKLDELAGESVVLKVLEVRWRDKRVEVVVVRLEVFVSLLHQPPMVEIRLLHLPTAQKESTKKREGSGNVSTFEQIVAQSGASRRKRMNFNDQKG